MYRDRPCYEGIQERGQGRGGDEGVGSSLNVTVVECNHVKYRAWYFGGFATVSVKDVKNAKPIPPFSCGNLNFKNHSCAYLLVTLSMNNSSLDISNFLGSRGLVAAFILLSTAFANFIGSRKVGLDQSNVSSLLQEEVYVTISFEEWRSLLPQMTEQKKKGKKRGMDPLAARCQQYQRGFQRTRAVPRHSTSSMLAQAPRGVQGDQ